MFDGILEVVTNNSTLFMGGGAAGIVLWVLKKVPNQELSNIVETFAETCGRILTLGLGKWSFTKKFWNGQLNLGLLIYLII